LNNIRTNYATNASKNILDASINYIVTNYATTSFVNTQINNLLNGAPDMLNSLNELANALNSDVSFGYNAYAKIASSDASINNIRTYALTQDTNINSALSSITSINSLNAVQDTSINMALTRNAIQDTSINNLFYTKAYIDASFVAVTTYNGTQDTSINSVITRNGIQDTSINLALSNFANYSLTSYVDGSLNANYPTKTYLDGSLNNIRIQLNTLTNGAPEALNTLSEIVTAINSDANFGIVVYDKIASSDA